MLFRIAERISKGPIPKNVVWFRFNTTKPLQVLRREDGLNFILPLPNKEKCSFPLYPHETVSDLIIDIREEDRENSSVEVKDVNGITIAHSTLISDLMKTPFVISIDKKEDYSVEVTPQQAPADKVVGTPEIEDLTKKALFLKVKSRLFEDPHRHHTTYPEYIKLCAGYGLTEAQAVEYLRALHISGFIYNFHDNPHLKEYIFLKPEAVTQTVTSMLGVTFATRAIPELKS